MRTVGTEGEFSWTSASLAGDGESSFRNTKAGVANSARSNQKVRTANQMDTGEDRPLGQVVDTESVHRSTAIRAWC
jgi:hypothetical protein